MRTFVIGGLLGLVVGLAGAPASAQAIADRRLDLTFHDDGSVSLAARNVSAREILAAWQQQCGCEVVNAEQLPGGAIMLPLQFERTSQRVVLQSLLRQAAGYVLTPPTAGSAPSDYGTIYILATSNPVEGATLPPQPAFSPRPMPTPGSPEDEIPPVLPIVPDTGMPGAAGSPAAQPPAASAPAPSNPFGSRTNNPFTSAAPGPRNTPGMAPSTTPPGASGSTLPNVPPGTTAPAPPGSVTPAPQMAVPPPPPAPELPSGTVVPIVPVEPDGN